MGIGAVCAGLASLCLLISHLSLHSCIALVSFVLPSFLSSRMRRSSRHICTPTSAAQTSWFGRVARSLLQARASVQTRLISTLTAIPSTLPVLRFVPLFWGFCFWGFCFGCVVFLSTLPRFLLHCGFRSHSDGVSPPPFSSGFP